MNLSPEQARFINVVSVVGTPQLAAKQLEISYDQISSWRENKEFNEAILQAKLWYNDGMNESIVAIGKKELLRVLLEGAIEESTTYETMINTEGEIIGTKRKMTRTRKGVPMSAIKMAMEMIPEVSRAIEVMVMNNALTPSKAEHIKTVISQNESQLRAALVEGKKEQVVTNDEMIGTIQELLTGG